MDAGEPVGLGDFAGRRVRLTFHPKADTPGCTKQLCALHDIHPDVEEKTIVVIGIGPDGPEKLAAFRAKYDLPFSDPGHTAAETYGARGEKSLYGRTITAILRPHVAIDTGGRVMKYRLRAKPLATAGSLAVSAG